MADSSFSAKSASPREENRSYWAVVSTWAGTPTSTAAATVQRPSPESDTRPENPAALGSWSRAWAVRSSSQDPITLPRRHSSATAATSKS